MLEDMSYWKRITAVSYTHLDVYKRQCECYYYNEDKYNDVIYEKYICGLLSRLIFYCLRKHFNLSEFGSVQATAINGMLQIAPQVLVTENDSCLSDNRAS